MASNDQIAVELVAKTDQFNQALAQATASLERFGQAASQHTKKAKDGVDDLHSSLLSFAADFAGAFLGALSLEKVIDLGVRSVETADKINKMSQQVGIATDTLSALQSQAALSDVGFDQFGTAMDRLAKSATAAAGGAQQQSAAYAAMGVSVTTATGQMRPMQDILQSVATKMAGYQDGAAKTALAQELFGRSGAQLIPLLNELGTQGFGKVREEAEKYNQVIGTDQAQASEHLHDNVTRLQQAVSGFSNAVMAQLLPVLVSWTTDLDDAAASNDRYASKANTLVTAVRYIVVAFADAKATIQGLTAVVLALGDTLGAAGDLFNGFAKAVMDDFASIGAAMSGNLADAKKFFDQAGRDITAGWQTASTRVRQAWDAASGGVDAAVKESQATFDKYLGTFANVAAGATTTAGEMHKVAPPIVAVGTAAADAAKQARELDAAMDRLDSDLDKLSSKMAGPYVQAQNAYNVAMRQLQDDAEAAAIAGGDVTEIVRKWQEAETAAGAALGQTLAQIRQEHDLFAVQDTDIKNLLATLNLEPEAREAARQALQKYDDLMKSHYDFYGNYIADENQLKAALDAQLPLYEQGLTRIQKITDAEKANDQATKDWVNIWTQAGGQLADTFASILVNGGSLFDSLASLAKQTVQQIIAYFAKLAIINPILNAIFGTAVTGGAGLLPTLASLGTSALGGAATDAGTSFLGGGNLLSAGQTIWQGFQNGWTTFFGGGGEGAQSMLGSLTGSGEWDFGGSTAGQIGSIAGGAIAGWQIGSQIGGTTGGILGAAGLGVAAYFIPIVGWIAAAATLINSLTGGGLFGTKGKVQEGSTTLSIGPGGADFANQVSLKGKKPLFGGSKWSTQDIAETPEQAAAAQAYFDAMTKQMKQYADQFGVKAGDLVSATFQQVFDKHGKLTGETHATIAGYNYDNLTQDQFSQAYTAANELTVLDQFDSKLEDTIATFRKSADTLVQIANGLTQAEGYLQAGGDFLAIAGKDTLSAIVTLAEGMQQSGETIDQTINRLIQAQQQYDQFVSQFKPAATYVDDFEKSLSNINAQMLANIKQANALAQAAGASGASEQDLANIHRYAAQQMAQAIAQLESSAQGLAFSLGLTSIGSLDAVNQEIAQLQAKANAGGGAIRGFGNAMQAAAQKATDAMNLLLGDLSPLNDQEKLQKALVGLRAGTATQEQVLQIGRRLYASSQAYTDLFNQVQAIGDHTGTGTQVAGAHGGGGLTGAESTRLQQLLKEQQQLQSQAQLQQYQTLAQQIAEIASAKGEDWRQVVSDMGIDLKAFEKGIGMNDSQLDTYIKNFQALKDSNGENTKSIVAVLNAILVQLGGTPIGDSGSGAGDNGGTGTSPRGHSGHGARDPRVDQIIEGFNRIILQQPRSQRTRGVMPVGGA